jgi:hypothetical protein
LISNDDASLYYECKIIEWEQPINQSINQSIKALIYLLVQQLLTQPVRSFYQKPQVFSSLGAPE